MGQLVPVADVQPWQLREQIAIRRKLVGQMVGSLYPGVVRDEIRKLSQRLEHYMTVTTILQRCRR